jgi:hypothetical protein
MIVVFAPALDVTSFENGYSTTEELVHSAVSKERVCNCYVKCISHKTLHGTTQPGDIVSILSFYNKYFSKCVNKSYIMKEMRVFISVFSKLTLFIMSRVAQSV